MNRSSLFVVAGAAGTHCGVCARYTTLVRALLARGHNAALLPLYTPLTVDGESVAMDRVLLGGINTYLQHRLPRLARLKPLWLNRVLDRPGLLSAVARFGIDTDPARLGAMTVSVLQGMEGPQRSEILRFLECVAELGPLPDVFVLSNAMLSSLALPLRERFGRPVLCMFEGEEDFLDRLGARYTPQAYRLIAVHLESVAATCAPSAAYAADVSRRYSIPSDRMHVVPPAVLPEEFPSLPAPPPDPFTCVFLAKPTAEKGIDLALEGFLVAASELGDRARTRLLVSAEGSRRTRRALEERIRGIRRRLPAGHELHYDPAPDLDAKQRLLTQAHALICPSRIPERRGMVCLEAMCSGVPVLVTRRGILPELVASTGGGQVLSENADPAEIGSCLSEWALSPRLLEERRLQAAAGVRRSFSPDRVCKAYLKVVDSVT